MPPYAACPIGAPNASASSKTAMAAKPQVATTAALRADRRLGAKRFMTQLPDEIYLDSGKLSPEDITCQCLDRRTTTATSVVPSSMPLRPPYLRTARAGSACENSH